jgi:intracellular septation protein A
MALLQMPVVASLRRPAREVEQETLPHPLPHPHPRAVLRRVAVNLLVACVIPGVVFYSLFETVGIGPAIGAALVWAYAAIGFRGLTGRQTSGMLLLTAGVLTVRTVIALAAHSTFLYFLQPVLTDLILGTTFLVSALTARPLVARLAGDFYPLTDEQQARPGIRRLFRRLTLLWALALLAKAAGVFTLLVSQPLGTVVLAKAIVVPVVNLTCMAVTVLASTTVARHEGLLPQRSAILPACPSMTTPATS